MTTLLALDIGGTKVGWGIVEAGDTRQIMSAPRDPYTRALIKAVPRL